MVRSCLFIYRNCSRFLRFDHCQNQMCLSFRGFFLFDVIPSQIQTAHFSTMSPASSTSSQTKPFLGNEFFVFVLPFIDVDYSSIWLFANNRYLSFRFLGNFLLSMIFRSVVESTICLLTGSHCRCCSCSLALSLSTTTITKIKSNLALPLNFVSFVYRIERLLFV